MKTTSNKTKKGDAKPQQEQEEDKGFTRKKFTQLLGTENLNRPDEPVVTPPEDIKKKPELP